MIWLLFLFMPLTTYDDIAPRYDDSMRRFERWWLGDLRVQALSLLPPNSRILEVGAGTGLNFVLYPPGTSGAATEKSPEMLRFAREKPRPSQVSLVQNCAEELPFSNSSFDAAFATLVFCSVASPVKAFEELRRVVRSGGKVVLLEHVRPNGLLGPFFDLLNFVAEPLFTDHFNRRTAETAHAAGLEVLEVRKHAWGIVNLITCRV
jgi:ubiquinone/menaquinone biosynthesis C-methylase UbiE